MPGNQTAVFHEEPSSKNGQTSSVSKRKAQDKVQKTDSKRQRTEPCTPKAEKAVQWVDTILKQIQYSVGHPTYGTLQHYSHPSILQLPLQPNIITKESLHHHYKPSPWSMTYPVPLVTHRIPNENRREQIDPMLKFLKAKKYHVTVLNNMRIYYSRKKPKFKKACKGREGKMVPNLVVKVAEHMERDPDRWFLDQLGYDYYFTGGSLAVINDDSFKWIVNTVGEAMDTVEIVPLTVIGEKLETDNCGVRRYDLEDGKGAIFEIINDITAQISAKSATSGNLLRIALRKKNVICIMCTTTSLEKMELKHVRSVIPFISCCFVPGKPNWLCTSDHERIIKIWDVSQDVILHSFSCEKRNKTDDSWSCIRAARKKHLICLDRTSLKLLKVTDKQLCLTRETPISSWLWDCEKASCLEIYHAESIIFVGTTHKLLVLRMFNVSEDEPPDFQLILTFTHNLKHYPTMISYNLDSSHNFHVWISSHLPGDSMLCSFSKTPPKRYVASHLPQKPFTIQESLHLARIAGKCIYPATTINQRVQLFHSGLSIITDSQHRHFLLQNSFGDVLHQQISQDPNESNASEIPSLLHTWMLRLNSFNELSAPEPVATDFKSLRGFKKIFTCANLKLKSNELPTNDTFRKHPRWQRTVEQLHQYKDLLAPDMLSIWGLRPDMSLARPLSSEVPMDVTDRVSCWLDAACTEDIVKEEIVVAIGEESEVEFVEHSPQTFTQTPQALETVISERVLPATPNTAAKKARKKHVLGF